MRNKKAEGSTFSMEELTRIILSVIGIVLLIILAVAVYNLLIGKTKIEQAKATLDQIEGIIGNLKEGEQANYLLLSPKGWYLVYYDKEVVESDPTKKMPQQCFGQDCLCVCPTDEKVLEVMAPSRDGRGGFADFFYYSTSGLNGLNLCEKKGVCRKSSNVKIEKIASYREWVYFLQKSEIGYVNWIPFSEVYKSLGNEIFLKKEQGNIIIRDLLGESPLISDLLSKTINFEGADISFNDFLLKNISNNCAEKDNLGNEFKINDKSKETFIKTVTEYVDLFKDDGFSSSFHFIKLYPDEKLEDISGKSLDAESFHPIYQKKLCSKDFDFYIVVKR